MRPSKAGLCALGLGLALYACSDDAAPGGADTSTDAPIGGDTIATDTPDAQGFPSDPLIYQVTPPTGPTTGGTVVNIRGAGFRNGSEVLFGNTAASAVKYIDPGNLAAVSPAGLAGAVDIQVVNLDGGRGTFANGFTYYEPQDTQGPAPTILQVIPNTGPAGGGTALMIQGSNFKSGATVYFDWKAVSGATVSSGSWITLVTPSMTPGPVDIAVTNPDGQSHVLPKAFAAYEGGGVGPTISKIHPVAGTIEGGTTVTVTGKNIAEGSYLIFGGVPVTNWEVQDDKTGTFVTPAHAAGNVTLAVTNPDGRSAILPDAYNYFLPPPVLFEVAPFRGPLEGGNPALLTGQNFVDGMTIWFGDAECTGVTVTGTTEATCTVPAADAPGEVDIVVETPEGLVGTFPDAYRYGVFPAIDAVVPAEGPSDGGIVVLLLGEGFSAESQVRFGDAEAQVVYFTGDEGIGVILPPGDVGTVDVGVGVGGVTTGTLTDGFTYVPPVIPSDETPTLAQVQPGTGPTTGGGWVLLKGFNLPSAANVTFEGVAAPAVQVLSSTQLAARVPAAAEAGAVDVVVTDQDSGAQAILADGYVYFDPADAASPAPSITWIKPALGPETGGTLAVVSGGNFQPNALVFVGGKPATSVKVVDAGILTFRTPAHDPGARDVTIVNPDGQFATLPGGFVYGAEQPPSVSISNVAPSQGSIAGGTLVTVSGSGFSAGTLVFLDGVPMQASLQGATSLTFTTKPHGPGLADLQITAPDGTTATLKGAYNFIQQQPIIAGVTPDFGPLEGGTQVLISGQGFHPDATVTFGGVEASVVEASGTLITVITPAGSLGAVDVVVTNPDLLSSTKEGAFTYTEGGAPDVVTITSIVPNTGPIGGGSTSTITGGGFGPGTSVIVGTELAPEVSVIGPSTLVVTMPGGPVGAKDVQVVVPNSGSDIKKNAFFHYDPDGAWPWPAFSGVNPATGPTSGGTIARLDVSPAPDTATVFVDGLEVPVLGADGTGHLVVEMPPHEAGAVSVSVMLPDGKAATLVGAFTYYVPGPSVTAPSVTQIAPTTGSTLGGEPVDVTGAGFSTGTLAFLGYRPVSDVTVGGASSLSGTTPAHPAGLVALSVTRPDGFSATLEGAFAYNAPPPAPVGVFPTVGNIAGGSTVAIAGTGFEPGAEVFFGGFQATDCAVPIGTVVACKTPAVSGPGPVEILVVNPDGQQGSIADAFTYTDEAFTAPPPGVLALVPNRGPYQGGTVLAIYGSGFQPGARALFGGVESEIHVIDETLMTVTTPEGFVGPVDVTILNPDGQSGTKPVGFEYIVPTKPKPVLVGITPQSGPEAGGTPVILTGSNFAGGGVGFVGYRPLSSWAVLNASIATGTTVGGDAGDVDVVITNGDGQSALLSDGFLFVGAPKIDSFSPSIGPVAGGTLVTIAGSNFAAGAQVQFGGQDAASVQVLSGLVIKAVTPPALAGPAQVRVTNPDGQSVVATEPFLYLEPPLLTEVFPSQGSADGGSTVIVRGEGFLDSSNVTFDGNDALTVSFVDAETLVVTTPAGAIDATVDVVVENPDGQSAIAYGAYTYVDPASIGAPPAPTEVRPPTGPTTGGTWGLVDGADFQDGAWAVFGTNPALDLEVLSPTRVRFVSPPNTAEGPVDVMIINPDGGQGIMANGFVYTDPATLDDEPEVTSIEPDFGPTGGGNTVTVTGGELDADTLIFFDRTPALATAVVTASQLDVTVPGHPEGTVAVVVTDAEGQTIEVEGAYSYVPPPIIDDIVPTQGPSGGGTFVEIHGQNFVAGPTPTLSSSVLFCEEYATDLDCVPAADLETTVVDDGLIALTTPAHFPGMVDVVVVNPDGQVGVAAQAYFYTPPPDIQGVAPPSGSTLGGETITITGTGFQAGASVKISGVACSEVDVPNATTITCKTPPGAAGPAAVTVINPDLSTDTLGGGFLYIAPPAITAVFPSLGPESGGTVVTIQGSGFVPESIVEIGGTTVPAVDFSYISPAMLQIETPPGTGPAAVKVINPDGQVAILAGGFLYIPEVQAPSITSLNPTFGATGGGYLVSVFGNGFLEGATVEFGNDAVGWVDAFDVVVKNAGTLITCKAPAHPAGKVNVKITNSDGQFDVLVDGFEYLAPAGLPGLGFAGVTPQRGPTAGGYDVIVYGQGFLTGVKVYFGQEATATWTESPNVLRLGPTILRAEVPPSASNGPVDVRISNPPVAGPDDVVGLDAFVYGQGAVFQPKGHRLPVDHTWDDVHPLIFDANGDGMNDILVFNNFSKYDDLYINTVDPVSGQAGWFVDQSDTNMPDVSSGSYRYRQYPIATDLDGDGDTDVVFRFNTWYLGVYRNAGDGTFTFENKGNKDLVDLQDMKMADINCDGIPDLVVPRWKRSNLLFVGDGTGEFSGLSGVLPSESEATRAVAIGDVDNDGDNDLLFANDEAVQNRLFYNNCNNKAPADPHVFIDAQYGTGKNFPVSGFSSRDVALVDLNNNGWLDAVIVNWGQSTRIYFNTGGNFDNDDGLHFPQDESLANDRELRVGDFDLDGDVDLMTLKYRSGSNSGEYWPALYLNDTAQGGGTSFADATPVNLPEWRGENTDHWAIGDMNQDGLLDIYLVKPNRQDWMLLNNGYAEDKSEVEANRVGIGSFANNTFSGIPENPHSNESCATGDIDGDGDIDIVMSAYWNHDDRVWVNDGAGNFFDESASRIPDTDCNRGQIRLVDLNGDGDLDIALTCNYISENPFYSGGGFRQLVNDGTGTFTDVTSTNHPDNSNGWYGYGANFADLDGDGAVDWFAVGNSNWWRVLINGGDPWGTDGAYFFTKNNLVSNFPNGNKNAVLVTDLNDDGYPDVYAAYNSGQNQLWHNDGYGNLTNVSSTHLPAVSDSTREAVATDVDFDGDVDIFVVNNGGNRLHIGELDYKFADVSTTNLPGLGGDGRDAETADFDRDGLPDFVIVNYDQANHLLLNVGGAVFDDFSGAFGPNRDGSKCVCVADFDKDGADDVFTCGEDVERIYLNKTPAP